MNFSIPIARAFGIPIRVHATFFLLPLFVAFVSYGEGGAAGALRAALLVPVLFVFVVLHELGHSVVAMRFGLRIRDITLLPIGGVARMEDPPRTAAQEILIALAGPAVNFVLAGIFFAGVLATGSTGLAIDPESPGLLVTCLVANLGLGLFNLFPAFPMDGGRVLRGLLATVLGFGRATRIAALVGQVFGVAGIAVGILRPGLFVLALVGFFVFIGAAQEARAGRLRVVLDGLAVEEAMVRHFEAVGPDASLAEVLEKAERGFQLDFPVVREGRLLGILSRVELATATRSSPLSTPVGSLLPPAFLTASPRGRLSDLYAEMAKRGTTVAAVLDAGDLAGLVTLERIARLVARGRGDAA